MLRPGLVLQVFDDTVAGAGRRLQAFAIQNADIAAAIVLTWREIY